jgi:hypothetical protein
MGNNNVLLTIRGFYDLVEDAKRNGDVEDWMYFVRLEALYMERGTCLCNTSRIYYVDGTDVNDLTKGEIVGFKQMRMIINFFRKYVPGGENAYIMDSGTTMGVRETRRAKTEYFVTTNDVYSGKDYSDRILTITRPFPIQNLLNKVDFHSPDPGEGAPFDSLGGIEAERNPIKVMDETTFQLPYRMLVPLKVENLLISGRLMGTEHMVETFVRDMTFCMMLGQVAGAAAALCVKNDYSPRTIPFDDLKKLLITQGYTKF